MMNWKHSWLIVLMVFAVAAASAQNPRKHIRKGNNAFEEGNFADAEVDYRKAVSANPEYYKGKFNLGDAMYEQKNMEESGKIFSELAESSEKPEVKSEALYNLGNTFMAQKKYKEAMQAFKKSLLLNPKDQDAKYNYEYARKKMIEQQKQQQKNKDKNKDKKDKNKDKNKDQNKDKQKQDKDKKDQDKDKQDKKQDQKNKQDQQKKDQQNKDQKDQKGDQQKQQQQQNQPQQMSKKDAQRMLNALKNDEKKTLQKLQKKKAKTAKAKKSDIDW
jgi:hypothetical protein